MNRLTKTANKIEEKLEKIASVASIKSITDLFDISKSLSSLIANVADTIDSPAVSKLLANANYLEALSQNLSQKAKVGNLPIGFASVSKAQMLDTLKSFKDSLPAIKSHPSFMAIEATADNLSSYVNAYEPKEIKRTVSPEQLNVFKSNRVISDRFISADLQPTDQDFSTIASMFCKFYPSASPAELESLINDNDVKERKLFPIIAYVISRRLGGSPSQVKQQLPDKEPYQASKPNDGVIARNFPEEPQKFDTSVTDNPSSYGITPTESGGLRMPTPRLYNH